MGQLYGPQSSNFYMGFQSSPIFNSLVSHWTEDAFSLETFQINIILDSILTSVTLSFTFKSFRRPPNTFVRVQTEIYTFFFLYTDANKKQCCLR